MAVSSVTVTWIDPTGVRWNLTTGDRGVRLDTHQRGLHMGKIEHIWDETGLVRLGVNQKPITLTLRILVGDKRSGMDWASLHRQWWGVANSPYQDGMLEIKQQNNVTRTLRCRILDTPDTEWEHSPLSGLDDTPVEVWQLTSEQTHWQGVTATLTKNRSSVSANGGWSNPATTAPNLRLPGIMYPEIVLGQGVAQNVDFGTNNRKMRLVRQIMANNFIRITTDPRKRDVVLEHPLGTPIRQAWDYVSGTLPYSDLGLLIMNIPASLHAAGSVTITVVEQAVTPF